MALVKNNRVENIILIDSDQNDFRVPEGFALVPIADNHVNIGDSYDGTGFYPHTEEPPIQDISVNQELADLYEAVAAIHERLAVLEGGAV